MRAIAVSSVVFFHAGLFPFSRGSSALIFFSLFPGISSAASSFAERGKVDSIRKLLCTTGTANCPPSWS